MLEGEVIGLVTSAASLSTGGWVGLASIKRSAETPCVAKVGDEVAEVAAVG